MKLPRVTILVGCLIIGSSLVAGPAHGETVGHDLVDRSSLDGAVGAIFILDDPFTLPDTITSFSFFQNGGRAGNQITPLLLTPVVPGDTSNWSIVGIGGTYTIADSANRQDFPFGLTSGTDAVDSGIYFGWKDGSNGSNNNGTIEFDNNTSDKIFYLGGGNTSFAVGDEFPIHPTAGELPRTYSVQASTDLIAPQLELIIDRETSAMTLANNTPGIDYTMLGYSITSDVGGLNPATWLSIAENYDADNPGQDNVDPDDTWIELTNPANRTDLSESELGGTGPQDGALFTSGQTIDLGSVWIQSPTEDVTANVLLDDGTILSAFVSFTGNGGNSLAPSDLDFNGVINADDWAIFKSGQGTDFTGLSEAEGYQLGDLDYDGDHDLLDFGLFEVAYDQANGAGALAGLIASVPEPSSLALLVLAGVAFCGCTLRRHATRLCLLLAIVVALAVSPKNTTAAELNWGLAFELETVSDLDFTGANILAANGGNDTGVVVGGVTFDNYTSAAFQPITSEPSWITSSSDGNPLNSFASSDLDLYTPATGDAGLDTILAATTYIDGPTVTYTLNGLTIGQNYQVQIIGQADDRACCTTFTTDVDGGDVGGGVTVHRFADLGADSVSHVTTAIGTFTADTNTQTFTAGGRSAGFSALMLSEIDSIPILQLGLTVNTVTGNITLDNGTEETIGLDSYQILSPGMDPTFTGSLDATGWNSVAERTTPVPGFPQGDGSGNGWEEGPNVDTNELVEWYLDDEGNESSLASGASINLGSAYDTGVDGQDLEFLYRLTSGIVVTGLVEYTDVAGDSADYDGNGTVDQGDLDLVLLNWGDDVSETGVPDGWVNQQPTGVIGENELDRVRLDWGNTFASTRVVPEPACVLLLLAACGIACLCRSRVSGRVLATR